MIQVKLAGHTPNPEMVVAAAARTCTSNTDYEDICIELKEEDIQRILRTVILNNHHSVLEHASFTFAISGISRVLTHQLVRHRIASYSQLSQQRTDSSQLEFTIPPEVKQQPELVEEYKSTIKYCQELYKHLVKNGVSKGSARYILPSASNTRIVTTLNARSLFNLLAQRECGVEEWEFQEVAHLMHSELMKVAPNIFWFAGPACETKGYCPESKKGFECPRYRQMTLSEAGSHQAVQDQPIPV